MRRLVALAAAAPFLAALPASADILSGCFGVGVTVCRPRVSHPVDRDGDTVDVCAGTCEPYAVPALTDDPVCVSWEDHEGHGTAVCTGRL